MKTRKYIYTTLATCLFVFGTDIQSDTTDKINCRL